MQSLFIIGANGQLGTALQYHYPDAVAVDRDELDITDNESIRAFDWSNIDIIINAAAYTNVDGAETIEGRAVSWSVNAHAVKNLVDVCREHTMTLVQISSEYIFDGTVDNHVETESCSPLSSYGASKAAGDIIAQTLESVYILRTTWLIGDGNNFVKTMMGLANKDISPSVVNDQIGRLTFTSELVKVIDHLLSTEATHGIYNATNSGEPASWADITRTIYSELGRTDLAVTDISTDEYFAGKDLVAQRPLLSTMDLSKLQSTGFEPTDWRVNLEEYIESEK